MNNSNLLARLNPETSHLRMLAQLRAEATPLTRPEELLKIQAAVDEIVELESTVEGWIQIARDHGPAEHKHQPLFAFEERHKDVDDLQNQLKSTKLRFLQFLENIPNELHLHLTRDTDSCFLMTDLVGERIAPILEAYKPATIKTAAGTQLQPHKVKHRKIKTEPEQDAPHCIQVLDLMSIFVCFCLWFC